MIGVIDYGAGNLQSVGNALDHLQLTWRLVSDPAGVDDCSRLILPGVGHFAAAMGQLDRAGFLPLLRAGGLAGRPMLGICLGMQLLFDDSAEAPGVAGLGLVRGRVEPLQAATVPHMGWNRVTVERTTTLIDVSTRDHYYFAHSFVCVPTDPAAVAATTDCGSAPICVAVADGSVIGVQFHPEKSAAAGLNVLRRFATC